MLDLDAQLLVAPSEGGSQDDLALSTDDAIRFKSRRRNMGVADGS